MLTRRQMALAPIIKTATERANEAFGKEVLRVLDKFTRGHVDFTKCHKQKDAVDMLYRHVRKALRGKGHSFARHGYIAKRMCKMFVSEIVKAGMTDMVAKEGDSDG